MVEAFKSGTDQSAGGDEKFRLGTIAELIVRERFKGRRPPNLDGEHFTGSDTASEADIREAVRREFDRLELEGKKR